MSNVRILALISAAVLAGCGSLPSPDGRPSASSAAGTRPAVDRALAAPTIGTAASSVFRHDAAVPPGEGYISGR